MIHISNISKFKNFAPSVSSLFFWKSYAFGLFNKPLSSILPFHNQNPLLLPLFPIDKGKSLRNINAYSGIKELKYYKFYYYSN